LPLILISTACVVTALSFGLDDTETGNGYISAGKTTISTHGTRGFMMTKLDTASCSVSSTDLMSFDTYGDSSESIKLANYIKGLPMYTVLIGETNDDAHDTLETQGWEALQGIAVNLDGFVHRGKVAFVAQIGRPSATISRIAPPGGNNLVMSVTIIGMSNALWTSIDNSYSYANLVI